MLLEFGAPRKSSLAAAKADQGIFARLSSNESSQKCNNLLTMLADWLLRHIVTLVSRMLKKATNSDTVMILVPRSSVHASLCIKNMTKHVNKRDIAVVHEKK